MKTAEAIEELKRFKQRATSKLARAIEAVLLEIQMKEEQTLNTHPGGDITQE